MRISDWSSDVCSSDLIASQVTDPGKRQMRRGDKGALPCEKVERLPAHGARLIRDDVIDDGHPGARKLDGAHMYGVAYEDHGSRAAAHGEEGGPGRMDGMYRHRDRKSTRVNSSHKCGS